jgi:glutamate synthase domain-containing protein 3
MTNEDLNKELDEIIRRYDSASDEDKKKLLARVRELEDENKLLVRRVGALKRFEGIEKRIKRNSSSILDEYLAVLHSARPFEEDFFIAAAFLKPGVEEIQLLPSVLAEYSRQENYSLTGAFITGLINTLPGKQEVYLDLTDVPKMNCLGYKLRSHHLLINGDVGHLLGESMESGKIIVDGNAGKWIGVSMKGGEIIVKGRGEEYSKPYKRKQLKILFQKK